MYVCVCVCMDVGTHGVHMHVCAYMCVRVFAQGKEHMMEICMCVYMCVCTSVGTHGGLVHACMYMCLHKCGCTWWACTYVCT